MKNNLKQETLAKIKKDNIRIKPKSYFRVIKAAVYALTIILVIAAVYIFNLIFYLPARALRLAERAGVGEYFSVFPWTLIIIGAVVVGSLIFLYRNYEGGYKKHLGITTLIIFGVILIAGIAITRTNMNEKLEEHRPFQRFYQWNEENFVPRGPRRRLHEPRLNYVQPPSGQSSR